MLILSSLLLALTGGRAHAALARSEAETLASAFSSSMKNKDRGLNIRLNWESDRVNAHATRDDQGDMLLSVDGGMLKHPLMGPDAFMAILCHELGHHLGGAPRQFRGNTQMRSWSSAEGQADYYAASKCLPALWEDQTSNEQSSPEWDKALGLCQGDKLCARVSMAGLAVARIFASLRDGYTLPALEGRTSFPALSTVYGHSTPQCRLETFMAGSLCMDRKDSAFDPQDPFSGTCSEGVGARPTCWFMPEDFR